MYVYLNVLILCSLVHVNLKHLAHLGTKGMKNLGTGPIIPIYN